MSFGGQVIYPGDIVLGDDDGMVVIRHDEAQWALEQARKRVEKESAVIKRLKAGESLFEYYNYQKVFDALGCVEEE
jgi:4-hydroxy-4-methyl-2-oxoglutarate aldolase